MKTIEAPLTKGERTRKSLLDAAETLFGQLNFEGVSIRDVAQRANVSLGVVSYHFKSKDVLFEETAKRRASEITAERNTLLASLQPKTVVGVLDAFARPILEKQRDTDWQNYNGVIHEVVFSERWKALLEDLFGDSVSRFIAALQEIKPEASAEDVARGFYYVISLLITVGNDIAHFDTFPRMASSEGSNDDRTERTYNTFLTFVVAGFEAIANGEMLDHRAHKSAQIG